MKDRSTQTGGRRFIGELKKKCGFLCVIGFHEYRVVEVTGGFGPGGSVEKRECQRCKRLSVGRAR